jgi:hypothetical protein
MILYKIIEDKMLILCDSNLIGKKIKINTKEFTLLENFYKGEPLEVENIPTMIKAFKNIQIIGEESTKEFIKFFPSYKDAIQTIHGIHMLIIVKV